VYSLGVMLYELLTGTTPFDRETMSKANFDDLRRMIREQEPPRPSTRVTTLKAEARTTMADRRRVDQRRVSDELRGELDWIVMKSLEKDRTRRYESASAMAQDLQRYLDDEPVQACPPSFSYRVSKSIRKHRATLITVALLFLGLLGTVAGTSWQAIRATKAERQSAERLANLSVEQKKTKDALLATEHANEEQRRMRIEAEAFALSEQEAATLQSELREKAEQAKREAQWNVYVAKLYPMQKALEAKDFGRLDTLLKESVPLEDEPDFRGWEWYYLRDRVDSIFTDLTIEGTQVNGPLAWNPMANEFATFSAPHFIDIWNADTLTSIRRIDCHGAVRKMEWSPSGKMIAVGTSRAHELIVLDAIDGKTYWRSDPLSMPVNPESQKMIYGLSWNRDNNRIAVGFRDGEIAIVDLDAKTTTTLRKPEKEELLGDLDWHPDGNRLAAGLRFGERSIFDVLNESAIQLKELTLTVGNTIAWNPSGSRLASSEGRSVRIADEFGKTICLLTGHTGDIERLVWTDDSSLVSTSRDQTIRTWDIEQRAELSRLKIHDTPVPHLVLGSSDTFVSTGSNRTRMSKFSSQQRELVSRLLTGDLTELATSATNPSDEKNAIRELKWSPNGTRICAAGEISNGGSVGGSCGVWNPVSLRVINAYQSNLCKGITWSSDGTQLLRAAVGNRMQADDFRTGAPIQSTACQFFGDPIAFWSPNKKYVATFGGTGSPLVRNAMTLQVIFDWKGYSAAQGNVVAWSPSGSLYISGGYGSPILFSMDGTAKKFQDQVSLGSFGIAWHPSEQVVALGNNNGNIVIRDCSTFDVLSILKGHTSDVMDLAFSPNGRRLASASIDGTVRIWDFATGAELMQLTAEGVSGFSQVEWSPDGLQLAAGTTVREIVVFGSNELQPTPSSATSMESGAVLKAIEHKSGNRFDWQREVPKLAWRDPLAALQRYAGGLDGTIDATRFNHQSKDLIATHSGSRERFTSLIQAWLVLAEAHLSPESAVFLVDRLLEVLSENITTIDEEQSLAFQLEALTLAGQRSGEAGDRQLALQRAASLGERLLQLVPNQPTHWRNYISVYLLQKIEVLEQYKQLLKSHDEQAIVNMRTELRRSRDQFKSFFSEIPEDAFFFESVDSKIGQSDSWTDSITQVELLHGVAPTFEEEWIEPYSRSVQKGSMDYSAYYQLALCHLVVGDMEAYRTDCQMMREKFDSSNDVLQLQFTAWTTALAPGAMQDYSPVIELAKRAEAISKVPPYHLAALRYRAGEFGEASDILLKLTEVENPNSSPAYVWYFLSMAEHQLGNEEQSNGWFEKATEFTAQQLADERDGTLSIPWNRRATLRLLDAEARATIATSNDTEQ